MTVANARVVVEKVVEGAAIADRVEESQFAFVVWGEVARTSG
jgi:hypothetical protein